MKPIPTVNVNLAKCPHGPNTSSTHSQTCPGATVPIPCPIPPSVTFTVRLGEKSYRICASINGEQWPDTEVDDDDIELTPGQDAAHWLDDQEKEHAVVQCRARWALVKALVMGHADLSALLTGPKSGELLTQRDTVFAALADMARAEDDRRSKHRRLFYALNECGASWSTSLLVRNEAVDALAAYAEHLIEQVGNLEGGE